MRLVFSGMRMYLLKSLRTPFGAWFISCCMAVVCFAVPLWAGEGDAYADLMRRYETVNDELKKALADLEYATPLPDVPERVLSIRKNAIVTIGGEMRATYAYHEAEMHDPGFDPSSDAPTKIRSHSGSIALNTVKLLVDARINKRWRVFMDFDPGSTRGFYRNARYRNPNGPDTANPTREYVLEDETDFIAQAYVELMKAEHSGFGMLAGKMKLPFGLWDRPKLFAQSFLDAPNLAGSYLGGADARSDRRLLSHASRFVDPVVALMVNYEMRDIIRFEGAVFQERDARDYREYRRDGSVRYRSESAVPKSWQIGASIMPLDGWELTMHFRNRHNAGRGLLEYVDSPHRWDFRNGLVMGGRDPRWDSGRGQWSDGGEGEGFGATRNEQSFIVGLAVEVPHTELTVRAEYARGWNQGFNRHVKSEDVNIGLSYRVTPRLTVHGQGEWMQVKDGSWMSMTGGGDWVRDRRNNHLYRGMVGVEYEVFRGLTFEMGWQYEYWRMKSANGVGGEGGSRTNRANMVYAGTRFVF